MAGKVGDFGAHPVSHHTISLHSHNHSSTQYTDTFIQIHLHGHVFAILSQSSKKWQSKHPPDMTHNRVNPARRDIVLMPKRGYIVTAFKADTPAPGLCTATSHSTSPKGLDCKLWSAKKMQTRFGRRRIAKLFAKRRGWVSIGRRGKEIL